jgi:riboflavin synthase
VDARGKIDEIRKKGQSTVMKIRIPRRLMRLVPMKGSIAVDGTSLTVAGVGRDWFTVSLVSYTLDHTNLGKAERGQMVNIETDVLAKYLDPRLREA